MSLLVSVIMPIRNEKAYIRESLESLLRQDTSSDTLEILCVDGMSDDGTREILADYSRQHERIVLVDNPKKTTACALNIGIMQSRGQFIIRVDAHSKYPDNYISKLLENMMRLPAENVGGMCEVGNARNSIQGDAIRAVLTSRFGVGNSLFRIGVMSTTEADTVPFGCYRRSIFDRIGFYDERLYRTEDYEFNQRIRKAGGKIFLVPDIKIVYFPPLRLWDFFRKQFSNGYGVAEAGLVFGKLFYFSIRHYTPLFFVLYLLSIPLLAIVHWIFLLPLICYGLMSFNEAFDQARKFRKFSLLFAVPFALLGTHCSHGLGALYSLVKAPFKRMARKAQTSPLADSMTARQ